jgi:hypothetical protein
LHKASSFQASFGRPKMKYSDIRKGTEVIGSDGILAGTVDRIEGDRIELVQPHGDANAPPKPHQYIHTMCVAKITAGKVHLSVRADAAVMFEERKSPSWQRRMEASRTHRRL